MKNGKKFAFNKQKPRTGKAWAKLYRAAAQAIPANERLCYGAYQLDDKTGVCATSVLALNLCPVDTLIEIGTPIIEKYKDGNDFVFVFDMDNAKFSREGIAKFIESAFTPEEIHELVKAATSAVYTKTSEKAERIASELEDFAVSYNDDFELPGVYKGGEKKLDYNNKDRVKAERARAKYVRTVFTEAAKFAEVN